MFMSFYIIFTGSMRIYLNHSLNKHYTFRPKSQGRVRVRRLILCRGAVFLCGHRCFGPLGRCAPPVSAPRSGAARSALSPAQRGKKLANLAGLTLKKSEVQT